MRCRRTVRFVGLPGKTGDSKKGDSGDERRSTSRRNKARIAVCGCAAAPTVIACRMCGWLGKSRDVNMGPRIVIEYWTRCSRNCWYYKKNEREG